MNELIKLFFFIPDLSYGGAQRTIVNVANNLSLDKKFKITILVINNKNNILKLNSNISLIDLNSSRLMFCIHKVFLSILKYKPNLFFSTTVHLNLISIILKFFLRRKKIKFIIRESNPTFYRNDLSFIIKKMCSYIYPYADLIISLSNFVSTELINNIKNIKHKLYTIGNPIYIEDIKSKSELSTNSKFIFEKNCFYLCFCGRISYQKNIELLINIVKKIKIKNIKIIIIGDGPEKNKAMHIVNKENINEHFIFLGYQKNPYYFIKNSQLSIITSRWEGFGHVILESLVCETPVVCFNTHGIINDFKNNNEVRYFKSDSLITLSENLKILIDNYDLEFKNFYPKKIYEKYEMNKISNKYRDVFLNLKN